MLLLPRSSLENSNIDSLDSNVHSSNEFLWSTKKLKFQAVKSIFQDDLVLDLDGIQISRPKEAWHLQVVTSRPEYSEMRQVVIEHEDHDDPIITLLKQFNALLLASFVLS